MNKIKVLNEEVANRIAAGEVIERPVSVVKELVENAIDSRATKIIVSIENGGKNLIQITDNGHGMNEEDALLAFERHATSKIRTVTDIFSISTLGFRGEALPSIASVSNTILVTKDEQSDTATKIEFAAGALKNVEQTVANDGTSVTVKKLFQNIPARRKFLKSEQVEYKHILKYIHYQSILHPHIQFILISNGKEKLNYPIVESKEKRLYEIFGNAFFSKEVIALEKENQEIKLQGFIYGLEEEFQSLNDIRYIFVNGRFIKDKIIHHAIKAAYSPFIKKYRIAQHGKTPPFILFLDLTPEKVDFNVHPAKLEIRFRDSQFLHSFVKSSITQALLTYEEKKFSQLKEKIMGIEPERQHNTTNFEKKIFQKKTDKVRYKQIKKEVETAYQPDIFDDHLEETKVLKNKIESISEQPRKLDLPREEDIVNPWQLHQSYIFVQVEEGLMVIDQHAAHERIIYEKIIQRIHGAPPVTQKLLFPLVIDIPPYISELVFDLVKENVATLQKIGFQLKTFSGNSLVIDEIPSELGEWESGKIFLDIMKQLEDEYAETENFRDSIAKSVACKAAIKAGKKLSRREMVSLINDLFACEVPYFCPHGRPLIIKIPLMDFEKKFKRLV